MRRLIYIFLTVCALASAPVSARMYQWLESGSGLVRLSGNPPPWYRDGRAGPRTLVFENGRLIDDTAITLPRDQEEALRNAAFREFDLKREAEAVKKLERAALREARLREESEAAKAQTPAAAKTTEPAPEPQPSLPATANELDTQTVDQMKSLIADFDKKNSSSEKSP